MELIGRINAYLNQFSYELPDYSFAQLLMHAWNRLDYRGTEPAMSMYESNNSIWLWTYHADYI